MHHKASAQSTPMHELIRLIEKIDTVIKDYLRQRFEVTAVILKTKTLEDIVARLRLNPNYYKELNEVQAAPVELSTYGKVKSALVTSYKYVDKTVRYYTNTDGGYRLDTLAWLCWSLRNFQNYLARYEFLTATDDAKAFQFALSADTKDFLGAIQRMLDEALPDEKSAFKLSRERKTFHIYGLKDDPSQLGRLLRAHLQDEFDCQSLIKKLVAEIDRKTSSLVQNHREREEEKKQFQQLEESNADLLRQLEASHNSMQQLKMELTNSRERAATIASELRIKQFQENTFERRIGKLEREKQALEKTQSMLDKNSQSVSHLQSELEAMQEALAAVQRERNDVVSERKALLSQVQTEHLRQEELQQKLTDAHGLSHALAGKLDQPEGGVDLNEDVVPGVDEEYEDDDAFDVARLTSILKVVGDNGEYLNAETQSPAVSAKANIALKSFPQFEEEFEDGLTGAQALALAGESRGLKALLKRDPDLVNTICTLKSNKNLHGTKTLLEIVLFDCKASHKVRKEMLATILQYRPDISSQCGQVFSDIHLRLQQEECHLELCQLFCEYVVAMKTCSSEALTIMKDKMKQVDQLIDALQEMGADDALRKLSLPLTVCRALRYGYINGAFSKSTPFLDGEKLADSAVYEVLYDLKKKQKTEEQYKRKFGVPLLRTSMINMLAEFYQEYQASQSGRSIVGIPKDAIISMTDRELQAKSNAEFLPSIQKQKLKTLLPQLDDRASTMYRDLVTHLITIIDRFGVILNSKGFNAYQRAEIALHIVTEDQEVEEVMAFRQSPRI